MILYLADRPKVDSILCCYVVMSDQRTVRKYTICSQDDWTVKFSFNDWKWLKSERRLIVEIAHSGVMLPDGRYHSDIPSR